jgi:hypothetical protein
MYGLDIGKKNFEGRLEIFVVANASKLYRQLEYIFQGSAKPSFGWYKVTKNSYEATTTTIRLHGAPKLGTYLIIMSSLGCQKLHT